MKRAWVAMLVAALGCGPAAGREYPPVKARVEATEVVPHVYVVQGGTGVASAANEGFNSNAGFVVTDEGVVVVDALGTPSLGAALVQAIRRVTPKPIRRLILTHYHADHFYGAIALKEAGAEIWAHESARAYLEGPEPDMRRAQRAQELFPWIEESMPIVKPDRWLGEHTELTLGGTRFEIDHMGPAHSPEDLIVVVPQAGVIFAGDILFAGRIPFVGEADSKAWLVRIDRLLAMNPRVMITGHGAVSRDPKRDLALTRDYLVYLRETMGRAAEDLTPFDEAYAKTDWSRFSKLPAFEAANRVNAYGTYLLMERELLKR
jgi:glyoxylase-like metal-dependent hydrolase (beta-lactamase superfamily II)